MKPKTQIAIGILTAIISLVQALVLTLIVLFTFRKNLSDSIILHAVVWPIVFSNGLCILFFIIFAFALVRRLFKASLFLLIVYFLLVVWSFLTAEYFDIFAGSFKLIFTTLVIFLLSLGVFGVYKEKHMAEDK